MGLVLVYQTKQHSCSHPFVGAQRNGSTISVKTGFPTSIQRENMSLLPFSGLRESVSFDTKGGCLLKVNIAWFGLKNSFIIAFLKDILTDGEAS